MIHVTISVVYKIGISLYPDEDPLEIARYHEKRKKIHQIIYDSDTLLLVIN